MVDSQYVLPNDIGIANLDCAEAFKLLSPEERLYAYYLSRACWYGGLVVLLQTSPEAPAIYALLSRLFRVQDPAQLGELARSLGLSDEEYQAFLVYAAGVYANMGNYKSFGDTKFVPNLPKEKLKKLVWESQAFKEHPEDMEALWGRCGDLMFSLEPTQKHLGLSGQGVSTYFSANCSMEDAKLAQEFLDSQNISAYNTRLFKTKAHGKKCYEVRLASVLSNDSELDDEMRAKMKCFEFGGCDFTVTRGDYGPLLEKVVENLQKALPYTANPTQAEMLTHYIASFTQGSITAHKEGSRCWIQDKGPIVESYIGFIESYRDPYGSRGEFEGFVAVVNKAMSAKFALLVASAECLLEELPWPRAFEKDTFLKPDFTSLDVLTFAGSGIPAGINIPNYDDIRQRDGFKNVSLGNVLAVAYAMLKEKLTFLAEEDKDLYIKWKGPSFEVQVGLHELLGHGSGKLFVQDDSGAFNFDRDAVINPETGELVRSWYRGGETWDSKFSSVASTYEECRAECVGLYLCLNKEVLRIFDLEGEDAEDVIYINWLNMVRAGLLALEFYTPESGTWRQLVWPNDVMKIVCMMTDVRPPARISAFLCPSSEGRRLVMRDGALPAVALNSGNSLPGEISLAPFLMAFRQELETSAMLAHMQARFVILRVLLEAGGGLVSLHRTTGADGKPNAIISLDRSKITMVGKPALESFLRKLQVLKSTADVVGGRALYEAYSAVTDDEPERFLTLRHTVLLHKEARKLFVQANTRLEGEDVVLVQYDSDAAGLIKSFRDRFSEDADYLEQQLLKLAQADAHFWAS